VDREHSCRIVRESYHAGDSQWALYFDGTYCENFASSRLARVAVLQRCDSQRAMRVVIRIEDDAGRCVSTERVARVAVVES
jgi:hypothetical protein